MARWRLSRRYLFSRIVLLLSATSRVTALQMGLLQHQRSSASTSSRSRFLSSSATAFLASTALVWANIDPEECSAAMPTKVGTKKFSENPRYIEKEMQMQYAEGPGTCACVQRDVGLLFGKSASFSASSPTHSPTLPHFQTATLEPAVCWCVA